MINKSNGEIIIDKTTLGPKFTRNDFLASNLHLDVLRSEKPGTAYIYYLKPQRIGENLFFVSLYFSEIGIINEIHLYLTKDGTLSEWKNWSLEKELEQKQIHDQWLASVVGPPPYNYKWGSIWSIYDDRVGSSTIKIKYSEIKS